MLPSLHIKKWLLTGVFFFIIFNSNSQHYGNFRLSIGSQINTFHDKHYFMHGLEGEYFLSSSFAFNYRLALGKTYDGNFGFHFPASWLVMAFLDGYEALVLTSVIPEGISYHTYPNSHLEISPYLNLLGSELLLFKGSPQYNILGNIGLKVYYRPNETVSLSASYGFSTNYRKTYFNHIGISLGLLL